MRTKQASRNAGAGRRAVTGEHGDHGNSSRRLCEKKSDVELVPEEDNSTGEVAETGTARRGEHECAKAGKKGGEPPPHPGDEPDRGWGVIRGAGWRKERQDISRGREMYVVSCVSNSSVLVDCG